MSDSVRAKDLLLAHLDTVFAGGAWHGAALLPSLEAFDARTARAPNGEGHSAWQVALHCAYWKDDVRVLLDPGSGPRLVPPEGGDFPAVPAEGTPEDWKAVLALLERAHRLLREAVAGFPDARLGEVPEGRSHAFGGLILGAAAHDAYHAAHARNLGTRSFAGE